MFVSAGSDCVSGVGTKLVCCFAAWQWTEHEVGCRDNGGAWLGAAGGPTTRAVLLTKSVSDKSWDSPLQKLIPLSVSPLLLCRLKLSPHSQSRILEISLGDWISNSAASKTIKNCSLSRQYSSCLFMMEYCNAPADKLIPHFCCSLFSLDKSIFGIFQPRKLRRRRQWMRELSTEDLYSKATIASFFFAFDFPRYGNPRQISQYAQTEWKGICDFWWKRKETREWKIVRLRLLNSTRIYAPSSLIEDF